MYLCLGTQFIYHIGHSLTDLMWHINVLCIRTLNLSNESIIYKYNLIPKTNFKVGN